MRRALLCVVVSWLTSTGYAQTPTDCRIWPQWQAFVQAHISPDSRVVDQSVTELHTVSEGQAYALFFALVAGERKRFAELLSWTQNNLAGGDLHTRLPGWQWGRSTRGIWQVLDTNSASDADLWMIYALLEAGRLWDEPLYTELGQSMAARLLATSTAVLPGLGRVLLPAPVGFQLSPGRWRLNPSYLPMPVLRYMAASFPNTPWADMPEPALRLLIESAPAGFSPEWIVWDKKTGWQPDVQTKQESSYNAIRTYLWAGMSRLDPGFEPLVIGLLPWVRWVGTQHKVPERIDAFAPQNKANTGPVGFDAAALPLLHSLGLTALRDELQSRIATSLAQKEPGYYNHALLLFSQGWMQGRYRFDGNGALLLPKTGTCLP